MAQGRRTLTYSEKITGAMTWLGKQPDTIFIGQQVAYPGNAMFKTLEGVPMEKRLELPVAEEFQMGMSIGLALTGKCVISIYPRFDFLLLAVNQLVNHLDKLEEFTHGQYHAKVIIRVGIGATEPMNPGVQHCGDYTEAFRGLLHNIRVVSLSRYFEANKEWGISDIFNGSYYWKNQSSLIIEDMNLYGLSL